MSSSPTVHPGIQCVWFKRDLRLVDHVPLLEASEKGPVLPVYIIEPDITSAPDFDSLHWGFIKGALADLRRKFQELGGDLWIFTGDAVSVFEQLHRTHSIEGIWSHEETGNALTYARDRAVRRWTRQQRIPWREFPTNGVFRGLKERDKWASKWLERMHTSRHGWLG